jgi:hypothetical protein
MRRMRGRGGMLSRRSLSVGRPGGLCLGGDGGTGNAGASGNGHGSDSAVTMLVDMSFFEAPSGGSCHFGRRARGAECAGEALQRHGNMRSHRATASTDGTRHRPPLDAR